MLGYSTNSIYTFLKEGRIRQASSSASTITPTKIVGLPSPTLLPTIK